MELPIDSDQRRKKERYTCTLSAIGDSFCLVPGSL